MKIAIITDTDRWYKKDFKILDERVAEVINYDFGDVRNARRDPKVIESIENNVDDCTSCWGVVTIPDEATDWDIITYNDQFEIVIFVVDGKIKYAFGGDDYEH